MSIFVSAIVELHGHLTNILVGFNLQQEFYYFELELKVILSVPIWSITALISVLLAEPANRIYHHKVSLKSVTLKLLQSSSTGNLEQPSKLQYRCLLHTRTFIIAINAYFFYKTLDFDKNKTKITFSSKACCLHQSFDKFWYFLKYAIELLNVRILYNYSCWILKQSRISPSLFPNKIFQKKWWSQSGDSRWCHALTKGVPRSFCYCFAVASLKKDITSCVFTAFQQPSESLIDIVIAIILTQGD